MVEKCSLFRTVLLVLLLGGAALPCAAITPALSGQQPDTYSLPKQRSPLSGTVDSIDRAAQSIVIDGKTYELPVADVIVHTDDPSSVAKRLAPGTRIRFRATQAQPGKAPALTEIWFEGENRGSGSGAKDSHDE